MLHIQLALNMTWNVNLNLFQTTVWGIPTVTCIAGQLKNLISGIRDHQIYRFFLIRETRPSGKNCFHFQLCAYLYCLSFTGCNI